PVDLKAEEAGVKLLGLVHVEDAQERDGLEDLHRPNSLVTSSFPSAVWERHTAKLRFAARHRTELTPGGSPKQSFGVLRSQTEFGNEGGWEPARREFLGAPRPHAATTILWRRQASSRRSANVQAGAQRRVCSHPQACGRADRARLPRSRTARPLR